MSNKVSVRNSEKNLVFFKHHFKSHGPRCRENTMHLLPELHKKTRTADSLQRLQHAIHESETTVN